MRFRLNHYIALLMAAAFVLGNAAYSFAETNLRPFSSKTDIRDNVENLDDFESTELDESALTEPEIPAESDIQKKQQDFLARIKDELNLSKTAYKQLLNSVSDAKQRLKQISEDQLSLESQMQNIDDLVTITTDKLLNVLKQVVETENEITILNDEMQTKETALNYQKILLKDYVTLLYKEEDSYFSFEQNGTVDAFKLLLTDNSIGENLKQLEYFSLLNEAGQQMIEKLSTLTNELAAAKNDIEKKNVRLVALKDDVLKEKEQMEMQKAAKDSLYKITLGQQEIYSKLLEQTAEEQEQVLNDIKNLGNAVAFIERKIAEDGDNFNPDDYLSLLDYKTQVLYNFKLNYQGNFDGLDWPVDPDRGISAYFRQASYVGVFGVQHNAVDLPAYQGSTVRAAADGVVYTAKDNGYGYSYIILAHADGLMTIYGHISEILVSEGDMISQGAVIGLSGGMPGTKGAGYMTTGPHLHFEVLLNGLYVDPLDYLPLNKLTEEQAGDLPEKYIDDWEADVYGQTLIAR